MPVSRRLVAVVVADVVGYSRLMERDEAGTHQRLRTLNAELIAPRIAEHGGRIVKTTGDGMLLEFPSATSALRCTVEVQREMGVRNLYVAPDDRIQFRIGINLGDIIVEGDDILGDGVNIAARLETLAEPGGICVASAIWEQVHEDLGIEFIDAGNQHVKNISKPIHVYRVALGRGLGSKASSSASPAATAATAKPPVSRRMLASVGALALIGAVVFAAWHALRPGLSSTPMPESAPLRSVMIMPFSAPGDDKALNTRAAELASDIAPALSASRRDIRVVPPKFAEGHAGKSTDPAVVGREANVRFLVYGDVRPAGEQVVFLLRLVDSRDGKQVDSNRRVVERAQLGDTETMVAYLTSAARVMLVGAIGQTIVAAGGKVKDGRDLVDLASLVSRPDPVDMAREQRRLADEAIKLEPKLAQAWAMRANTSVDLYYFDFSSDATAMIAAANDDSLQALSVDPNDPVASAIRGNALRLRGNIEGALAANDRAQQLDPTRIGWLFLRGWIYLDAGKPKETLDVVARVRRFNGRSGAGDAMQACIAHFLLRANDEAIRECEVAETSWPIWHHLSHLAAAYAARGDMEKAARARDRLLKVVPSFTISLYKARFFPTATSESIALDEAIYLPALRKAGVPE